MAESVNEAMMSPDASPNSIGVGSGVRRINNRPLILIGAVVLAFLLVMAMVAAQRSKDQQKPVEQEVTKTTPTKTMAAEVTGKYSDGGVIPADMPDGVMPEAGLVEAASAPAPAASAPVQPAVPIATPAAVDLTAPPLPAGGSGRAGTDDEALRRIHNKKAEDFEAALSAKTSVQAAFTSTPKRDSAAIGDDKNAQLDRIAEARRLAQQQSAIDPTAAYKEKLEALQQQAGMAAGGEGSGGLGGGEEGAALSNNARNDIKQFAGTGAADRWRLDSQREASRTRYELRAGFVIPAILITGINSDLPGQILAQVSENVYDTATGKYLLIPQGSRLVGTYSSDVIYGQERVLSAWQRIVFPDGSAFDLGAMAGADAGGNAGFNDQVNHHYMRVFGSSLMMSVITAGVSVSQDTSSSSNSGSVSNSQRANDALSEALGQQLGQAAAAMLMKNLNIAPTLEIRSGYRLNVMVTKDLTFAAPYKSFNK